MRWKREWAVVSACWWLCACGSGGGDAGSGSFGEGPFLTSTLQLLEQSPGEGAVQVPVDAELQLQFDGVIAVESLQDEDTWLRAEAGSTSIQGTFVSVGDGRTVAFRPGASLQPETDYLLQLSPLTCDRSGRILERIHQLRFRTFDVTPPTVVSASVAPGQQNVVRTEAIVVSLSEALDPASVRTATVTLRDLYGNWHGIKVTLAGDELRARPQADLPGDRGFALSLVGGIAGLRDRAGNSLEETWTVTFRTAPDTVGPSMVGTWPAAAASGVSPLVPPTFHFDESMDPGSVEPSGVIFQDEFGTLVPYAVKATQDQRTLRLMPQVELVANRSYTVAFRLGPGAVTDVSGNPLRSTMALSFRTGSDLLPPALVLSHPTAGQTGVAPHVVASVTFDERLDPASVDATRVRLRAGAADVPVAVELVEADVTVRVTPVLPLETSTDYVLTLQGEFDGVRDRAGNPLGSDLQIAFTTSAEAAPPQVMLLPSEGATQVPVSARVVAVVDRPLDPDTVGPSALQLFDDLGNVVAANLGMEGAGRVLALQPAAPLLPGVRYRVVLQGGPAGVRPLRGNWLPGDVTARFTVGPVPDPNPPTVHLTINGIVPTRNAGLCVPPWGFTLDLTAIDQVERSLDPASFRIEIQGPGPGPSPDPDAGFASAAVGYTGMTQRVAVGEALPPGAYVAIARARDLSGNLAVSAPLAFGVVAPHTGILPFERTQVVWARTDLDRDGNGTADFDDDLLRLGLQTAGDPIGRNARMRKVVLDGIFAKTYELLGRGSRGELLGSDSAPVRLTSRLPLGVPHSQMALGGLDPEGSRTRRYGDPSTGVLGRAYYDHRNSRMNDLNIASRPGLGVFPSEMFLYQARLHQQLYPSFITLFAQRFLPLCPDMGGVPAGAHAEDPVVLDPGFAWSSANSAQRARWQQVFQAADDWVSVIGIILAHEIGHSVGLTAPGPAPYGLFGDSSLHDQFPGATDVMAATVGYEAMVTLQYAFRDVTLAYLRQRLVLP